MAEIYVEEKHNNLPPGCMILENLKPDPAAVLKLLEQLRDFSNHEQAKIVQGIIDKQTNN